jgi:hypothetical protein
MPPLARLRIRGGGAPSYSNPNPALENALFTSLYRSMFSSAVPNELRPPLPFYLRDAQQQAINDYLTYEATQ